MCRRGPGRERVICRDQRHSNRLVVRESIFRGLTPTRYYYRGLDIFKNFGTPDAATRPYLGGFELARVGCPMAGVPACSSLMNSFPVAVLPMPVEIVSFPVAGVPTSAIPVAEAVARIIAEFGAATGSSVSAGMALLTLTPVVRTAGCGVVRAGVASPTAGEAGRPKTFRNCRFNLSRVRSLGGVPESDPATVVLIISILIEK